MISTGAPAKIPLRRLRFIDLARTIAILLMLEGHFVSLTLGEAFRDPDNAVYAAWNQIRGFTAPMFFTVTGLIFTYLLLRSPGAGWRRNERVKKGFRRAAELVAWGYVIQLNFRNFFHEFHGWQTEMQRFVEGSSYNPLTYLLDKNGSFIYAFMVLQAIGLGITLLLLLYGLSQLVRFLPLAAWYGLAGLCVLALHSWMAPLRAGAMGDSPVYFPPEAHPFFQNMFIGRYSIFPVVPYAAYVLMGGMVGALIRRYEQWVRVWWFPILFILGGLLLRSSSIPMLKALDTFFQSVGLLGGKFWLYNAGILLRMGEVLAALGVLMLLDLLDWIPEGLVLKIGQHTLPIYVVHVIILYDGLAGYGISLLYKQGELAAWAFHPAFVIPAMICFLAAFVLMVHYLEPLERGYTRFLKATLFRRAQELGPRRHLLGAIFWSAGFAGALHLLFRL